MLHFAAHAGAEKSTSAGGSILQRAARRKLLNSTVHFKINRTNYENLIENTNILKVQRYSAT
jgi:hypothetical protein